MSIASLLDLVREWSEKSEQGAAWICFCPLRGGTTVTLSKTVSQGQHRLVRAESSVEAMASWLEGAADDG